MSTFDMSGILKDLESGAIDAAKEVAGNMVEAASKDATAFITMAMPSISRYITLLMTNQITLDEFKSLFMGLLQLAEMTALTEAGLAEIEIDKTRNYILKTVTSIAIGAVSKIV